jgi:hypothetical protein
MNLVKDMRHPWRINKVDTLGDDDDDDDDDNNNVVLPTWAVGALFGVRDVFTSTTYVFTYPYRDIRC